MAGRHGYWVICLALVAMICLAVSCCAPPEDDFLPGPIYTPDIDVWIENVSVPSGGTLECGAVGVLSTTDLTLTIWNSGGRSLALTGTPDMIPISGSNASDFEILSQPAPRVVPGESTSFTMRFLPPSGGLRTADLSIPSDDPDENPYLVTLTATAFVPPAEVPDTGQTSSWADGDDGQLRMGIDWPSPRFTDNGDGTVTDGLTGMMWEKAPPAGTRTWAAAVAASNALVLGTCTDWRLANVRELASLVNAGESNPAAWLNSQGFTGVQSATYWTSTGTAGDPNAAWVVRFDLGGVVARASAVLSRCSWSVRDGVPGSVAVQKTGQSTSYFTGDDGDLKRGAEWPSPRFVTTYNGTTTDLLTGLEWVQSPSTGTRTWADAIAYASELVLGGHADWRLPSVRELACLINFGQVDSAGWLSTQLFWVGGRGFYWSSTSYAPDTTSAWGVAMDTGNAYYSAKSTSSYTWAVRGGR